MQDLIEKVDEAQTKVGEAMDELSAALKKVLDAGVPAKTITHCMFVLYFIGNPSSEYNRPGPIMMSPVKEHLYHFAEHWNSTWVEGEHYKITREIWRSNLNEWG